MIFSDLSKLQEAYFEYNIKALFEYTKIQANPEMINDGEETAPSKRIINCIDCFDKANMGVDVLAKIGVKDIARKCRHFAEWIRDIERRILGD